MNRSGKFIKDTLITFSTQGLNLILALVSSIIIARALGPKDQGIYSLTILLPTLLIAFINLGIGPASIFYIGKKKFPSTKVLGTNVIFSVLLSIIAIIIGTIMILFFADELFPGVETKYLFLALFLIPFQIFLTVVINVLVGLQKIEKYNFILLVRSLVFLLLLSALLWVFDCGIQTAIVCLILSFSFACIILFIQTKKETNGIVFSIDKSLIKDFLNYGSKIYITNVITFLHLRIDMFLINMFLNPLAVGYYTIAVGLSERIWLVSQSVGTVLFPKVASETNEKKLKEFTPIVCRNIMVLTLLIALILFFLSRWLIIIFYSEQYSNSVLPFQILLIGTVAISGSRILANDLAGRGKLMENMYLNAFSVVLNIIFNVILIPRIGISGAALATTISYTITFVGRVIIYSKVSGNKTRDIVLIKKSDFQLYVDMLVRYQEFKKNKYDQCGVK